MTCSLLIGLQQGSRLALQLVHGRLCLHAGWQTKTLCPILLHLDLVCS